MTAYVSEFCICIRHPEHEKGQESTFHVVLTEWAQDFTGEWKPRPVGPMSPERAEALGFPLDKVLGEVNAAAIRDVAESRKLANAKTAELEKALDERARAVLQADQAIRVATDHQTIAAKAVADKQAALEREAALLAEIAVLTAPQPSLLNKLTFGILDKPE